MRDLILSPPLRLYLARLCGLGLSLGTLNSEILDNRYLDRNSFTEKKKYGRQNRGLMQLFTSVFLSSSGFPPLPGVAAMDGDSTIAAVLESASKLANMEENDEEEEVSIS